MSAASNYLENELLDHALGTGAFSMPTPVYLALFVADSGGTGVSDNLEEGTLSDEVSGNGYSRQRITFGAASGGTATSNLTCTFTASGGNWGTVQYVAIMDSQADSASGENVLFYGALSSGGKIIEDGDSFQVSSGNLTVTLA